MKSILTKTIRKSKQQSISYRVTRLGNINNANSLLRLCLSPNSLALCPLYFEGTESRINIKYWNCRRTDPTPSLAVAAVFAVLPSLLNYTVAAERTRINLNHLIYCIVLILLLKCVCMARANSAFCVQQMRLSKN